MFDHFKELFLNGEVYNFREQQVATGIPFQSVLEAFMQKRGDFEWTYGDYPSLFSVIILISALINRNIW